MGEIEDLRERLAASETARREAECAAEEVSRTWYEVACSAIGEDETQKRFGRLTSEKLTTIRALRESLASERAAREKAEKRLAVYHHFSDDHPAMCCGQCMDAILAAEAALASERAAREKTEAEVATLRECLLQAQNAAIDLTAKLEKAERERDEAREEIARHPRRCTVENKCEPCRSEERAWEQAEAAESRAERAEAALREQERWLLRCADEEGNLRWKNTMLNRARACRAALAGQEVGR